MGMTIIYLKDEEDGVSVSSESIGSEGNSERLANQIINSLMFLQDVYYCNTNGSISHPASLIIQ